jgi:TPP-dependent 2-oxoacid decarboxylase
MLMPKGTTFIAQVFYGSIGYSVGAALGAGLAAPQRPLVLIVGDGSFQARYPPESALLIF